jgi:hypothetical protein
VRGIALSLLLLAAACGSSEKQSVVVVTVTARPPLPAARKVDVKVGEISRSFATKGLEAPVSLGVFIEASVSGMLTVAVTARAADGGCLAEGTSTVSVLAGHEGVVVPVDVTVSPDSGCGGGGSPPDGGTPPGDGAIDGGGPPPVDGGSPPTEGGAPPAEAGTPDGPGAPDRPLDLAPPADTAPPPPANPPSLTKCTVCDHGPMDCGPMISPFQRVLAIFSPDGTQVVSAGAENGVKFWKVSGGTLTAEPRILSSDGLAVVAFTPDGGQLAVGSGAGMLYLFDFKDGSQHALAGHAARLRGLGFTRDGTRLLSVDRSGLLRSWDVGQRTAIGNPIMVPGVPATMAVAQTNPAGELWAAVAVAQNPATAPPDGGTGLPAGGHVYLVNVNDPTRHQLLTLDTTSEEDLEIGLALSTDGKRLAAGGADTVVKVWDVSNPSSPAKVKDLPPLMLANGNSEGVTALGFSPDGRFLAAGYGAVFTGERIRLFDAQTFTIRNERDPDIWWPISLAFSPAGNALLAGSVNCNKIYYCQD